MVTFEAHDDGRFAYLWRDGAFEWSCELEEFIPLLKADMIEMALKYSDYEIALHAGAYILHDRALLLLGAPGAGKTTLGMALVASGFDLLADDVVLLQTDGRVSGMAFPHTVKSGAWSIVEPYWVGVTTAKTHRRPDGLEVRYAPAKEACSRRCRIGRIAILNRRAASVARLEPIDAVDALRVLLSEATSETQKLTSAGFSALIDALSDVRCCTLQYSSVAAAAQCLREFCE